LGVAILSIIRADQWTGLNGVQRIQVVDVVQTVYRDTFGTSVGDGWADIPGFSCSIRPRSNRNRIIVNMNVHIGAQYWQVKLRLLRNGTVVDGALGNVNGVRPRGTMGSIQYDFGAPAGQAFYDFKCLSAEYMDAPNTTGNCEYKLQFGGYSTSYAVYINRGHNFSNNSVHDVLPISTLTLWEISG